MSVQPESAPYRPAYVRDASGLYYKIGGAGGDGGGGGGGLDQATADGRYVNQTGDEMTGDLDVAGSVVADTMWSHGDFGGNGNLDVSGYSTFYNGMESSGIKSTDGLTVDGAGTSSAASRLATPVASSSRAVQTTPSVGRF